MQEHVTVQTETDPNIIDLAVGHPDPELLPIEMVRAAAQHRFDQMDPLILQYGEEQGETGFRRELAGLLQRHENFSADPDMLFITSGSSMGLHLLCDLYTQPGDLVLTEEPSYFLALRIFQDHRLNIQGVPTDKNGIDPEGLEAILRQTVPRFLYIIPSYQNPSGATLSNERRLQLLELAEKYDFLIIADEAYHLLNYTDRFPLSFGARTASEHPAARRILSLGTFSKTLGPGLRLGWIQAAREHMNIITTSGVLDSGGGLNHFTSTIVRSAIASGSFEAHVGRLREVYRSRMNALTEKLQNELGDYGSCSNPGGGYFVWFTFHENIDTAELLPAARTNGVSFLPGHRASTVGGQTKSLRLSISYNPEQKILEGVNRLMKTLQDQR